MTYEFPVHVTVGRANQDRLILLDQARRLLDLLGGPGIRLKRGQKNRRFVRQGYLRFVFKSRALARKYQDLVDEFCASAVTTKRYRRPI
jgi:hypothetical protein